MTPDEQQLKIENLESTIESLNQQISELSRLLNKHTHSGIETSGRLQPKYLLVDTLAPSSIEVGNGASGSFIDKNDKVITVVSGIVTNIT